MFSNTHAYIAENVFKKLVNNNGIIIDRMFFKYGSIKPDFAPRLVNIGHYEDESMDFIQFEIKDLASSPFPKDKDSIKQYSIRLGVIIHFLSDYFCYAHNNKVFKKDIFKHFMYEAKLEGTISKFQNHISFNSNELLESSYIRNIKDYLIYKIHNYNDTKVSYFNDLKYAIEVSYTTCCSIINASLDGAKSIAA